ncbi:MAG TPA: hypothetical protein VHG09_01795 [Longimicrobiales bacterium]|nr:hypothetical protein [Longimicrobiales bacterium]
MTINVHAALTIVMAAQLGAALPPDSVEALRESARDAEARFERLSRWMAPLSWSSGAAYECDEIVGRFCLRFDSTGARPESLGDEAARVIDARREAVESIRRYFAAAPHERSAAGPLVRLLIRDGRAGEAASAAGAFAALSRDTLWGELLQGLARHAAGEHDRAERHFIVALHHLSGEERRTWLDPEWLLDPGERRRVRRLGESARSDYQRRFWLLADPFWLTPENERWNEHIARHVKARLLADVPTVTGMVSWGRDLDELMVRYGSPTAHARQAGAGLAGGGMVEYWDTAQRAFAPTALTNGVPQQPQPGERPLLYAATARSAYTMQRVGRVIELEHQVTRFLRGDSVVLRIDAALPCEAGAAPDAPPRAGVFVYDSAFTSRVQVNPPVRLVGDTARLTAFISTVPGPVVYSAEMLGDSLSNAGRARYALNAHVPGAGPVASDLLVSRPFPDADAPERLDDPRLRPFESLIFQPGDTLGVYAEVYRLDRAGPIEIEVALESAERPSLLGRFANWIGRGLGLVEAGEDPRVGWRGEAADERYIVALNVPLPTDRDGLQDLVLRITDSGSGEVTESRRRILLR